MKADTTGEADLPKRIQALDVLRGIACLLVVIFHCNMLGGKANLPLFVNTLLYLPSFLWCGVDIFFVLSGFLITGLLLIAKQNRQHYFKNFYARRALRLLPVYYAVLVIVTFWNAIVPTLMVNDSLVKLLFWLDAPNWALSLQSSWTSPFDVTWSLGVEEQFYLVWSVLVFLLVEKRLKIVLLLVIIGSPLLRLAMVLLHGSHHLIHISAFTRSDGLAIGCLLAMMLQDPHWQPRLKRYADWGVKIIPFCILAYVTWCSRDNESTIGLLPGIPLSNALAACMLIYFAGLKTIKIPVFTPVFSFIGKLSYSGYLLHMIVMRLINHFELFPFNTFAGIPFYWAIVQPLYTGTIVLVTFFISWLFWITFEQRILAIKVRFEP